jgi:hypothetical protein
MPDFKFNCPHCKQSLEAPDEMLGQTIECPSCKGKIVLPKSEPEPPHRHQRTPPQHAGERTYPKQTVETNVKQGALTGGLVCFVFGVVMMCFSLWTVIVYAPLFLAAFVLSIVAMAQKRIAGGVLLLVLTVVVPPILLIAIPSFKSARSATQAAAQTQAVTQTQTAVAEDGFKGLYLRMSKDQFRSPTNSTQWRVWRIPEPSTTDNWILKPEKYPDALFPSMAVRSGTSYDVDEAGIIWYSNRVQSILLSSPVADADTLRAWCEVAIEGLTRRYGQPSKVERTTDRIDEGTIMLNARPSMPLSVWETKLVCVIVAICEAPGEKYRANIFYSDNTLSAAEDAAKSTKDFNAL